MCAKGGVKYGHIFLFACCNIMQYIIITKQDDLKAFTKNACQLYQECCASSMYQGQGQVITSHGYDGM